MAQPPFAAAIPTSPLVDEGGNIRPEWRSFFASLYFRSGGSTGIAPDITALTAALALERTARSTADQALTDQVTAERLARQTADTADTQRWQSAVNYEVMLRRNADALLVPLAQLCSLWAGCDLSFLPVADPGHGKPWLDGIHISVGTAPGALVNIGLEDVTGDWAIESMSGEWQWG